MASLGIPVGGNSGDLNRGWQQIRISDRGDSSQSYQLTGGRISPTLHAPPTAP